MGQGREIQVEESMLAGDAGMIRLFGIAVLIWASVIAAAIWMF